jgi:hypothetical protein
MATFGQVLLDLDCIISDTAPTQNAWETDKRGAYAALFPQLMGLATDLQRREALLIGLLRTEQKPHMLRHWRARHEAVLEVMEMLGVEPAQTPQDLLI